MSKPSHFFKSPLQKSFGCKKSNQMNLETGSKGFTLVEVIIALALLSLSYVASHHLLVQTNKLDAKAKIKTSILTRRLNTVFHLTDNQAWVLTRAQPEFDCIATDSCSGNIKFRLRNGDNDIVFDGTNNDLGFTVDGADCLNFTTDATCANRLNLFFSVTCATCIPKQIEVTMQFESKLAFIGVGQYQLPLIKNTSSAGGCWNAPLTFTTSNFLTIPSGCDSITLKLWGGGGAGGGGNGGGGRGGDGGGGAFATCTLIGLSAGDRYTLAVGGGGRTTNELGRPGAGGGASIVYAPDDTRACVAGGGGGGGGVEGNPNDAGDGGPGGGASSGGDGGNGTCDGGKGATNSAHGAGGSATAYCQEGYPGGPLQGRGGHGGPKIGGALGGYSGLYPSGGNAGHDNSHGGGGGGGYFGGGGGSGFGNQASGGGGGGSSYAPTGTRIGGSGRTPGNSADPDHSSNYGQGGLGSNGAGAQSGEDGVIIVYGN